VQTTAVGKTSLATTISLPSRFVVRETMSRHLDTPSGLVSQKVTPAPPVGLGREADQSWGEGSRASDGRRNAPPGDVHLSAVSFRYAWD